MLSEVELKKRELEARLMQLGFWRIKGAKHDKWTDGYHTEAVPRHSEINEYTAKAILLRTRQAQQKRDEDK